MAAVDLMEDRDLAIQLHKVLSEIDPARWRDEMAAVLKPKLAELQRRFEQRAHHAELSDTLKAEVPGLDTKHQWLAFKQRLQPAYLELAKRLKAQSIHVPSLRPTNYARNVFHIGTAIGVVALIEVLNNPALALGIAAFFAVLCQRLVGSAGEGTAPAPAGHAAHEPGPGRGGD